MRCFSLFASCFSNSIGNGVIVVGRLRRRCERVVLVVNVMSILSISGDDRQETLVLSVGEQVRFDLRSDGTELFQQFIVAVHGGLLHFCDREVGQLGLEVFLGVHFVDSLVA
jgi:hypothetical protein